ncbi:YggT family protein [Altererythrobacter sp. MTPC7]|uniref:YggT family protein n=1 Tax=Altererythrobacter sp. MTPC7 TaxID=3056567 RepID=UPI0036F1F179
MSNLLFTLIQIVDLLTTALITLVIIQFVIGLLFAFNVINQSNEFMASVYRSINALLEPILAPIRRLIPSAGAIDFSPLVLIILLQVLMIVLTGVARSVV